MQTKKQTIHSIIETISLKSYKNTHKTNMHEYFLPTELKEMKSKPIRTMAGMLAVKRALVSICSDKIPNNSINEKCFELGHTPNGAPFIKNIHINSQKDFLIKKEQLSISITHNKINAHGLAVYQEI